MQGIPSWFIALLRVATGWLFAWNGWQHLSNDLWTPVPYIQSTHVFTGLYSWFVQPNILEWVIFLNTWGMIVLGVCLIIGFSTRFAAIGGIIMVALYYIPTIDKFPFLVEHNAILISDHIFYILILFILIFTNAGSHFGFGKKLSVRLSDTD